MAVVESKVGRFGLFLANPMVAKINKVEESGEPSCTAKGISLKVIFFLLLTIAGVAIFFATSSMVPTTYMEQVEGYEVNLIEAAIAFGSIFIGLLGTFISFKFVRSSFLFGSIYSLGQGYGLAFLFHIFGYEFVYPGLIALGLTILIVLVMLFLYQAHIVKVEKKFLSCLATLIVVGALLALGVYVMTLIPATKEYADFIINNSIVISIAGAIGIIVATLFLLVDFEVINHSLQSKLPKKYEWLSAFALSFSIIEIYFKIFNFIIQAAGNKNEA